ncbi:hypothetical protein C2S52_012772 [Perilla frutescens var. hirtella]|nr:hypothetical protein C2S51_015144 [Perilla frutescens var. frutescens]KAH6775211.1 hypothetical protein C2S52_012772 [Perilla frutescens var. hirtella]
MTAAAANIAGQFGDTTYTKVFVGGLAWETQKDTMKKYFEQFGEILEAVVITDKTTGRSKGYGFVTFREPDAAMRACVDAAPVIDGRRANCNLASLGVQRSKPSTPKHGISYYGVYGGASAQYPLYGSGSSGVGVGGGGAYYPYLNLSEGSGGGATGYSGSQGYGVQYPHGHLFQYSTINSSTGIYPPHYGTPVSLAPQTPLQSAGVNMALHAPIPHR